MLCCQRCKTVDSLAISIFPAVAQEVDAVTQMTAQSVAALEIIRLSFASFFFFFSQEEVDLNDLCSGAIAANYFRRQSANLPPCDKETLMCSDAGPSSPLGPLGSSLQRKEAVTRPEVIGPLEKHWVKCTC